MVSKACRTRIGLKGLPAIEWATMVRRKRPALRMSQQSVPLSQCPVLCNGGPPRHGRLGARAEGCYRVYEMPGELQNSDDLTQYEPSGGNGHGQVQM